MKQSYQITSQPIAQAHCTHNEFYNQGRKFMTIALLSGESIDLGGALNTIHSLTRATNMHSFADGANAAKNLLTPKAAPKLT